MRINEETKTMDIEQRDVDYILPAYVRMYLFKSKNVDPDRIIFPMFRSVPHPIKKGVTIPVEYVLDNSPIAMEIIQDGGNVKSGTPESEAKADKAEQDYDKLNARLKELEEENKILKNPVKDAEEEIEEGKLGEEDTFLPMSEADLLQPPGTSAIGGVDFVHQPSEARLAKGIKQPTNPAPEGSASDYGPGRDARDLRRTAQDLAPDKDINEDDERPDDEFVHRVKKK